MLWSFIVACLCFLKDTAGASRECYSDSLSACIIISGLFSILPVRCGEDLDRLRRQHILPFWINVLGNFTDSNLTVPTTENHRVKGFSSFFFDACKVQLFIGPAM
ncbi:hypothetical protein Peur_027431 [Populus x canadensis]